MVRFEETKYVWKPANPTTDHTEKKQMIDTTAVNIAVKEKLLKAYKFSY